MSPVRVLIADDDPTLRESLGELINDEATLELAGIARDADEAVEIATATKPDVALLDVRMPGGGGPSATRRIKEQSPETVCVALSAYEDSGAVLEMLRAGVVGYLVKGATSIDEIVHTIALAAAGRGGALSPDAAAHVVEKLGGRVQAEVQPDTGERVTVLVADDDPGFLSAMSDLIAEDGSLELVGAAGDAESAVRLACTHLPDVAVIDVRMPGGGASIAREIRNGSPATRVAALSMWTDRSHVLEMLRAGSTAYVLKDVANKEILDTIKRTAAGQVSLSAGVTTDVIDEIVLQLERGEKDSEIAARQRERIERVLGTNTMQIEFQPIVDLRDLKVAGFEALARFAEKPWRSPDVWFGEADHAGLRRELELAAVRRAFEKVAVFPAGAYIAINLSAQVVASKDLLAELGDLPAHQTVIELSESSRVDDYEGMNLIFKKLRDAGFRLAIDDVGVGVSLSHILNLAPDLIKLDIGLCRNVDADEKRGALVAAFVSFAARVGIEVVAEGIEREEELTVLRDIGVSFGQGFHLGRPGPLPATDP